MEKSRQWTCGAHVGLSYPCRSARGCPCDTVCGQDTTVVIHDTPVELWWRNEVKWNLNLFSSRTQHYLNYGAFKSRKVDGFKLKQF